MKNCNNITIFKNSEDKSNMITFQVTDSFFILFPYNFTNCFVAIRKIMILQLKLAIHGIYLRGAIEYGAIYINQEKNIYFGEAWNKAVVAEEKAMYLRIIINNNIANIIGVRLRKYFNESVGKFFSDNDNCYVVDSYGSIAFYDIGKIKNVKIETLKKTFTANLNKYVFKNSDNKITLNKYKWIAEKVSFVEVIKKY